MAMEWMPVANAKDDSWALLGDSAYRCIVLAYYTNGDWFLGNGFMFSATDIVTDDEWTHCMPLDTLPQVPR